MSQFTVGVWAYHWDNDHMAAPWLSMYRFAENLTGEDIQNEYVFIVKPEFRHNASIPESSLVRVARNLIGLCKLRRRKFDVFIDNVLPAGFFSAIMKLAFPGKRKWIFVHGHGPWEYDLSYGQLLKKNFKDSLRQKKRRLAIRFSVRFYDHFLVNSDFTKEFLIKKLRVRRDKITTIPFGVDKNTFKAYSNDDIDDQLEGLSITRPYFLHIANSDDLERKGTVPTVKAFKRLLESYPSIELVVVGERFRRSDIYQKLSECGLDRSVITVGNVTDLSLAKLYNGAEGLVFPSLHEGFGMPIVEAMACGCPVLGTNWGAIPEVGGDALKTINNPTDVGEVSRRMREMLDDREGRKALIDNGLIRANRYNWKSSAIKIDNVVSRECSKRINPSL